MLQIAFLIENTGNILLTGGNAHHLPPQARDEAESATLAAEEARKANIIEGERRKLLLEAAELKWVICVVLWGVFYRVRIPATGRQEEPFAKGRRYLLKGENTRLRGAGLQATAVTGDV